MSLSKPFGRESSSPYDHYNTLFYNGNSAFRSGTIYLHYVLDVWFEETVRAHCRGEVYLCRYADDFVCLFQNAKDAERFYKALIQSVGAH